MKFTYFNQGTAFQFNPTKTINIPNSGSITSLDYYRNLVKDAKSPAVFILNEKGKVIAK